MPSICCDLFQAWVSVWQKSSLDLKVTCYISEGWQGKPARCTARSGWTSALFLYYHPTTCNFSVSSYLAFYQISSKSYNKLYKKKDARSVSMEAPMCLWCDWCSHMFAVFDFQPDRGAKGKEVLSGASHQQVCTHWPRAAALHWSPIWCEHQLYFLAFWHLQSNILT